MTVSVSWKDPGQPHVKARPAVSQHRSEELQWVRTLRDSLLWVRQMKTWLGPTPAGGTPGEGNACPVLPRLPGGHPVWACPVAAARVPRAWWMEMLDQRGDVRVEASVLGLDVTKTEADNT